MLRHLLTLPLIFAIALPIGVSAAPWPAFSTRGTQFIRDGRPYQLISGAIHFQRIPRAYWKDRLQKARAMGLNTVETYVFWNLVELREGQFDFTGNNDIGAFVREAASQGLNVILRPRAICVCRMGGRGFPAWLFADPTLRVRSQDPRFLDASQRYLEALGTQVRPLLNSNGGPIIAMQVENEYGSYGDDHGYLQAVRALFIKAGLGGALLFTSDGAQMLGNGTLPDVLAAVNVAPVRQNRRSTSSPHSILGSRSWWVNIGRGGSTSGASRTRRPMQSSRLMRSNGCCGKAIRSICICLLAAPVLVL